MMWLLAVVQLTLCISYVKAASISTDLQNGVCLCVNEPNVKAVSNPREPNSQITILTSGACFLSNGGIYHSNGDTWYELVDTSNGQKGWVDSFYLNIYLMSVCNSSVNVIRPQYHTPSGQPGDCTAYGTSYNHGQPFTAHNMECICDDGAILCSLGGKHCTSDNIVYKDGQGFSSSRGQCECHKGAVTCGSAPSVGK